MTLITLINFMWAIFEYFWNSFVLFSTKNITFSLDNFLCSLYIRRKKDVQMAFDDSYIIIVNRIDVYRAVLCFISLIKLTFCWKILLGNFNIERKKCGRLTFDETYILFMDIIDSFLKYYVLLFFEQLLLKKFSLRLVHYEKKMMYNWLFIAHLYFMYAIFIFYKNIFVLVSTI